MDLYSIYLWDCGITPITLPALFKIEINVFAAD